jgi:maleate cis-trans isomerase
LILPSLQTVTEPLYYRLAPPGVAFFSSRVLLKGASAADLMEMETAVARAAEELATAKVDCVVYCCTAGGALKGLDGEKAFCEEIAGQVGAPTTSTVLAVVEALEVLGMRRLIIASPYTQELDTAEKKFFEENGFEVLGIHGMEIRDGYEFAEVHPEEIYKFSRQAWQNKADGIFLSCMNWEASEALEALEKDLGKPAVSSHSATLWKALSLTNVREPIRGYGRLLEEHLSSPIRNS